MGEGFSKYLIKENMFQHMLVSLAFDFVMFLIALIMGSIFYYHINILTITIWSLYFSIIVVVFFLYTFKDFKNIISAILRQKRNEILSEIADKQRKDVKRNDD